MKKTSLILLVLATGATVCLTGGCVVPDGPGYVGADVEVMGDPPPLIVETPGPDPGEGFIWIRGSWAWNDGHWAWESGRWLRPPHAGEVWVPHRYVVRNGRHVFVRGGWR